MKNKDIFNKEMYFTNLHFVPRKNDHCAVTVE